MAQHNGTRHQTAFTVSIEAREGVTTGISASDRARTIAVAIDPGKGPQDIVTPGHVFPLMARDGGVLVRAGHTEAAVDIARLAGLNPAGVICEIMNDDGTMARRDDLIAFAQRHGLKIGTIADLIAYRRRHDRIVERVTEVPFQQPLWRRVPHAGLCQPRRLCRAYRAGEGRHQRRRSGAGAHACPERARRRARRCQRRARPRAAHLDAHDRRGGPRRHRADPRAAADLAVRPRARARRVRRHGAGAELRDYGVGAQILLDLGVHDMMLLSNTKRTIVGLEGYGLKVVGQRQIDPAA